MKIEDRSPISTGEELTGTAHAPIQGRRSSRHLRSRSKKPGRVILGICLLLIAGGLLLSPFAYMMVNDTYHQDISSARVGAQDLETAIAQLQLLSHNPFNAAAITVTRNEFTDALTHFTALNNSLVDIPDLLTSIPSYGSRLHAAKLLVPLAMEVAEAGLAGCTIVSTLTSRLQNPLNTQVHGLTMEDVTLLGQNIQQIKIILSQAIDQVNQLHQLGPAALQFDPHLGKLLGEFRSRLPLIQQGITAAEQFIIATPAILGVGRPAYYLVEVLDSSELRPGGGFIGNYGIATLSGGRLATARITDTYLLDKAFTRSGQRIPFPSAYRWFVFSNQGWSLRDSNLDADFPTSARAGEMLYAKEGGSLPLAGVIAITPAFIQRILTLTGPVAVPEYQATVTAQNLLDSIHTHQLVEDNASSKYAPSPDGHSSVRKRFTELLAEHLLARIHAQPGNEGARLLPVLLDALHAKDLQLYFNADAAEQVLQTYHLDDSISPLAGDGILVVDANITPSKANKYLVTTIHDQVTLDSSGNALHHTVISFTWTEPGLTDANFYGGKIYRDYVRVYAPHGSVLYQQSGWAPYLNGTAFGRTFWGGYFHVLYPHSGTITLEWAIAGAAKKDASGWHYSYLVQRQAGAQQDIDLQVTLPSCAAMVATTRGVSPGGKQRAYLSQPLSSDTRVRLDYAC